MQSQNLDYTDGMNYGMGVNLVTGEIAGKGVDPGQITPGPTTGQKAGHDIHILDTMEDLYKSIGISAEAGGHFGLFSAEGKFQFANETKFHSQSKFLLARIFMQNPFSQCEDAQLKPSAAELLVSDNNTFRERFGDGFVRGMRTGGEYFAVLEITSSNLDEQEKVAISLHAQYGMFGEGRTNVDFGTHAQTSRLEINISTYQAGGRGEAIALTKTPDEVLKRLQAFPNIIQQDPVPYRVQVASYNTLNLPSGTNLVDIQNRKEFMEDYTKKRLELRNLLNEINFVQLHPDYFENPPAPATLNNWSKEIADQLSGLTHSASDCASDIKKCDMKPFQVSDKYTIPKRKADAPTSTPGMLIKVMKPVVVLL